MDRLTRKEFDELLLEENIVIRGVKTDKVYDTYYSKVYPYLDLIGDFMSRDAPASEKQLRRALGVGTNTWGACKKVFVELNDYLDTKESYMHLKVELDLEKGLQNTEYKQPKLQEMRQQIYNRDRYKPKADIEVEMPKTLTVVIEDAGKSDEELKEFEPIIE